MKCKLQEPIGKFTNKTQVYFSNISKAKQGCKQNFTIFYSVFRPKSWLIPQIMLSHPHSLIPGAGAPLATPAAPIHACTPLVRIIATASSLAPLLPLLHQHDPVTTELEHIILGSKPSGGFPSFSWEKKRSSQGPKSPTGHFSDCVPTTSFSPG